MSKYSIFVALVPICTVTLFLALISSPIGEALWRRQVRKINREINEGIDAEAADDE